MYTFCQKNLIKSYVFCYLHLCLRMAGCCFVLELQCIALGMVVSSVFICVAFVVKLLAVEALQG